jgi:hypothetical protein
MDQVIKSISEMIDEYHAIRTTIPFFVFAGSRLMEPYFEPKPRNCHRGEPPHEGYCLRVRQDYYSANIHNWQDFYYYWYDAPIPYALYAHKMWLDDEIVKLNTRRMTVLLGASYKNKDNSVLSKINKHGIHHASRLRRNIMLKADL